MTKAKSLATLTVAAVLIAPLAATAATITLLTQPFAAGLAPFTVVGAGTNTWNFNNTCAGSINPVGHTAPGVARWGTTTSCASYDSAGQDDLNSPIIVTTACKANVFLEYNYLVNFQESHTFDQAFVNRLLPLAVTTLASTAGGLLNNNTWNFNSHNLGSFGAPVQVQFRGNTLDTAGNGGQGFLVDDVVLKCDDGVVPSSCDLTPVLAVINLLEAKADDQEVKLDGITTSVDLIEGKSDVQEVKLDGLTTSVADLTLAVELVEAKLDDSSPCDIFNLFLGVLIDAAKLPTTHPCYVAPAP